jgi:hypothetical protein
MKKLYLHIGHGKTGSSFIQSFLSCNVNILNNKYGINYPIENSEFFKNTKKGFVSSGNGFILKSQNLYDIELLCNTTLFSAEYFFNYFLEHKNEFLHLKTKYKLKIFIFTRNLISLKASQWHQSNKKRVTEDFNDFVLNNPILAYSKLTKLLLLLREHKIDYIVRNYSNHKDNLIQTFLSDLTNQNCNFEEFSFPKNKVVNRSLDRFEIELLQSYLKILSEQNNYKQSRSLLSDYFVNLSPNIISYKPQLNSSTYEFILKNYKEQVLTLNKLLPTEEQVIIEDISEYYHPTQRISQSDLYNINKSQIKTLSGYLVDLEKKMINTQQVNFLKNLAIQLHKQGRPNALKLIRIVKQLSPNDNKIDLILKEYLKKYSNKNENK